MALTQISTQGIKDGTITNADLSSSAAIARTKLANVDLVDDTSPQLGGNLDTNSNLIIFPDSNGTTNRLLFGTNKFQMLYDSGNSRMMIDNITGDFIIRNQASGGDIDIIASDDIRIRPAGGESGINLVKDGAVELYHNGSKKFETTSYGNLSAAQVRVASSNASTVAFSVGDVGTGFYNSGSNAIGYSANGTQKWQINSAGDLNLADNVKGIFGDGLDLQIYHDGNHSYIQDAGTGNLILKSNVFRLRSPNDEEMIIANENGNVKLYHDNSKKFETTSTGVDIHGSDTTGSNLNGDLVINNAAGTRYAVFDASHTKLNFSDNASITLGTSNDFIMFHDSSGHTYLQDQGNGALRIRSDNEVAIQKWDGSTNENMAKFIPDGAVELYYDNSKKFETTSSGVTVTGTINFGSGMGSGLNSNGFNINFADSDGAQDMVKFGASGDLQIFHDGNHSRISDQGTGFLVLETSQLQVNNAAGNEAMIVAVQNGAVELYHDNTKRFETTSSGAAVNGAFYIGPPAGNDQDLVINKEGTGTLVRFRTTGTTRGTITSNGSTVAYNTSASDKSMKKNFEDWTEDTLALFKNINPQRFNFLDQEDGTDKEKGFIAQDLVTSFPEAYPKINDKYMFNPSAMVVYLMKAIQELETEVAALKAS